MTAFLARTEETLASLTKQRTILNVRKKRRQRLYTALADAEALAPARELYEEGVSGMETEFTQYLEAVSTLEQCGVPREQLISEKAQVYQQLAELNRQNPSGAEEAGPMPGDFRPDTSDRNGTSENRSKRKGGEKR